LGLLIIIQTPLICLICSEPIQELDVQNNLYYYRNRYYDPLTGRFLQEDPIEFEGGINFYTYVGNNPILFIDPLGLRNRNRNPGGPIQLGDLLPDVVGCFGSFGIISFEYLSSQSDTQVVGNTPALGGGILLCWKIDCSFCPKLSGGGAGRGTGRMGIAVGIGFSGNLVCFAIGPFASPLPIGYGFPLN